MAIIEVFAYAPQEIGGRNVSLSRLYDSGSSRQKVHTFGSSRQLF